MKSIVQKIFEKYLQEEIHSIVEIRGFGSVNRIFEVRGENKEYILRLNSDPAKNLEYQKEQWCMEKVAELGIPTPQVLKMGSMDDTFFMVLGKISGINGINCNDEGRKRIWERLGTYAAVYQKIKRIENQEIEEQEFHKNWEARLEYNIEQLDEKDSLLKLHFFNRKEQERSRSALSFLRSRDFKVGLVHGDLCPRNVLWSAPLVYLLDWGTAEINVIPHTEIGIVQMEKEATEEEFELFLKGLGMSALGYQDLKWEIDLLNFLHRLDKYRWAESHATNDLADFADKVKSCYAKIVF